MTRTTQTSDRPAPRRLAIFRRAGTPAATRPAIRMPDTTPWTAPALRVVPPDPRSWPFGSRAGGLYRYTGDPPNGWWIMYTLDTTTGELGVRTNDGYYRQYPDCSKGYGGYDARSGVWVHGSAWDRAPLRIGFPRQTSTAGLGECGTEIIARELALIAPRAERLLGGLQPVPGTARWDWTTTAVIAHAAIRAITQAGMTGEEELAGKEAGCTDSYPQAISFEDLLGLYPELRLAWPTLAAMPDAELDALAEKLSAHCGTPSPPDGVLTRGDSAAWDAWYHRMNRPGSGYASPYVVGARAGLYRLRAQRAEETTGYPVADAARVLAVNPALTAQLTADTADDALARAAADLAARTAHDDHINLAGTESALMAERARLRAAVRAELEQAGRDVTAAEDRARQLRTARAGLVARVIAWQDPADYDHGSLKTADLARRAGMTEHGLRQLRARLEDTERPDPGPEDGQA